MFCLKIIPANRCPNPSGLAFRRCVLLMTPLTRAGFSRQAAGYETTRGNGTLGRLGYGYLYRGQVCSALRFVGGASPSL